MDNTKNNTNDTVSYNQVLLLLIGYRIMVGLTYMPSVNIPPGNQDIWIVSLLSIVYVLIFNIPLIYLSNKFSNLNLLELTEKIMGKVIGKLIGIFYFLTLLFINTLFVGILIEILNSAIFPLSPTWFNTFIVILTSCYVSFKGLNTIARLVEVIVPVVMFIIFLLIMLGYKNYNFGELLPILKDSTFKEINIGAMEISLRYFDILVLTMITPNLMVKKDLNRIFVKSILYSVPIIILLIIVTQMTLGVEFTKHVNFPFLTFTRMLSIGEIQGFDSFYIVSWIMGNVLRVSGYLYFTSVSLGQITGKKNQIFIVPISIIMSILIVLIKDRRSILAVPEPIDTIVLMVSIISIVVIPSMTLVVYFFRRKTYLTK
jgi:spore germination protein KB